MNDLSMHAGANRKERARPLDRGALLIIISALSSLAGGAGAAAPTIDSVAGTVATGQELTITGTNMVQEDKACWSPFNQAHPEADGFEGPSPSADGYSAIGPSGGVYDPGVKILGDKSMRFHVDGPAAENVGSYNAHTHPARSNSTSTSPLCILFSCSENEHQLYMNSCF